MSKLEVLYKDKKSEVYSYYLGYSGIDSENIIDVNDKIIDEKLKKEDFDNELLEFYITVSMCLFMIENDLYDEYFFNTYAELYNEYKDGKYDNLFMSIIEDKSNLESDIDSINEYIKKEAAMSKYYDDVSDIYNSEMESIEEKLED